MSKSDYSRRRGRSFELLKASQKIKMKKIRKMLKRRKKNEKKKKTKIKKDEG